MKEAFPSVRGKASQMDQGLLMNLEMEGRPDAELK